MRARPTAGVVSVDERRPRWAPAVVTSGSLPRAFQCAAGLCGSASLGTLDRHGRLRASGGTLRPSGIDRKASPLPRPECFTMPALDDARTRPVSPRAGARRALAATCRRPRHYEHGIRGRRMPAQASSPGYQRAVLRWRDPCGARSAALARSRLATSRSTWYASSPRRAAARRARPRPRSYASFSAFDGGAHPERRRPGLDAGQRPLRRADPLRTEQLCTVSGAG